MRLKNYINEAKKDEPNMFKGKYVYGDEEVLERITPNKIKKMRGEYYPLANFPKATFKLILQKQMAKRSGNDYYVWRWAAFDKDKLLEIYYMSSGGRIFQSTIEEFNIKNGKMIPKKSLTMKGQKAFFPPSGMKPKKEKPVVTTKKIGRSRGISILDSMRKN